MTEIPAGAKRPTSAGSLSTCSIGRSPRDAAVAEAGRVEPEPHAERERDVGALACREATELVERAAVALVVVRDGADRAVVREARDAGHVEQLVARGSSRVVRRAAEQHHGPEAAASRSRHASTAAALGAAPSNR